MRTTLEKNNNKSCIPVTCEMELFVRIVNSQSLTHVTETSILDVAWILNELYLFLKFALKNFPNFF